ncbi:NADH-quinone oxidoreductase subunit NuoG [Blochmannia endosymbiont of Colobopsis nipponica]|uniref:NADH-quinone oxidoreductase subunit NuoG n=1 Tax=Blochmannia endosymbiont of Colobopsis nipponica TaxID=2681987 RepID=UPI00177EEF44|nr:NADH-quinone oxidoreductase subunit NuoG [Blochmannia endosymbiont of Colobopsis nipponica]QOI10977.1 NADH-quinone oxidoreductase subunit NuoG [Blochmannia endosymbiont of Colobopsis nipponica]
MAIIIIDGKNYEVYASTNLLAACLSLGFDLPYFCWHPALGSIGACRQCVIKQYQDNDVNSERLIMACMTPVSHGIRISLIDDEVQKFRQNIIELLMINHPHDCPVCEEGGNCHLQDMTVMVGKSFRRYRFNKRTYRNQYLGPFISHEMNRCISCYRCVRYYRDYADGDDLGVYGAHDNIYFGRVQDGALDSEFSGNLVEICPTGVFTDKTHSHHYARKWDTQFSPSICQQCSVGCNIVIGERYGELCRVENRYNGDVNGYFLCDRGRFGCDYINLKNRLKRPIQKQGVNRIFLTSIEESIQAAVNLLNNSRKIIGIGSSRASVESNFALRELVGQKNFYTDMCSNEHKMLKLILDILGNSGLYTPSLREIEDYDAILILGEDITQTAARIALSIRQAVKNKAKKIAATHKILEWQVSAIKNFRYNIKYPLFITNIDSTKLDDIAACTYYDSVNEQVRFGFAIAHALDSSAPKVNNLDFIYQEKFNMVVQGLLKSSKPLIISGTSSGSESLIAASANIAKALKKLNKSVGITYVVSDANSIGLAMLEGNSLDDAFDTIRYGLTDCVILLENNLCRRYSTVLVDSILDQIKTFIVLDHQYYHFQDKADLVLPSLTFAESDGTLISQEGRAQRFFKCYKPDFYDKDLVILESWRWLNLLHSLYLKDGNIKCLYFDDIIDVIVKKIPRLIDIKKTAPTASFRVHGQKLSRLSHRYSGRTAIHANVNVQEPSVPCDPDSMFVFSMEGNNAPYAPRQHISFAWVPGWNSPQAWNKFQNYSGGHLHYGDPGIRLFKSHDKSLDWFNLIPLKSSSVQKDNCWRIVSYWHLFGSEEMSQRSVFIQKRMLEPYVMLNKDDADLIGVNSNMFLFFICADQEWCLPIKFSNYLNQGYIGLPLGFPGFFTSLLGMCARKLRGVLL